MWILFALLARFFWACMNAIDQVLARAHPRHKVLAAIAVESLPAFPVSIAIYLFLGVPALKAQLLFYSFASVVAVVLGAIPYYMALRHEHAHNVTPYLELTPVFVILLAYFFKGEILTHEQMAGAALVILSGVLFSWDFTRGRFKLGIFAILAVASLLFAFYQYSVSQAQPLGGVWLVAACFYFGRSMISVAILFCMPEVRKTILGTFVRSKGKTLLLACIINVFSILGLASLLLAFRYAPTIGHVAGLSGAQPIISFLLAIPLAIMFPKHFSKIKFNRATFTKMSLVIFIALGIYLLA